MMLWNDDKKPDYGQGLLRIRLFHINIRLVTAEEELEVPRTSTIFQCRHHCCHTFQYWITLCIKRF